MRRIFSLLLLGLVLASCGSREVNKILKELDKELASSSAYQQKTQEKIVALKAAFTLNENEKEKFSLCSRLCEMYLNNNLDSAEYYSVLLQKIAFDEESREQGKLIGLNVRMRKGEGVEKEFDAISPDELTLKGKKMYHLLGIKIDTDAKDTLGIINHCKEYILLDPDANSEENAIARFKIAFYSNQYKKALEIIKDYDATHPNLVRTKYHLGVCQAYLGQIDDAIVNLAKTAILDLKAGHKEYMALYDLSYLIFDKKQYSRAIMYMDKMLQDKLELGRRTRIEESAISHINYVTILQSVDRRQKLYISLICLFLVVVLVLVTWQLRYSKRKNKILTDYRYRLEEANQIKETYLFRYMVLATEFLSRLQERNRTYTKIGKEQGLQALMKELRNPSAHYSNIEEFFEYFDSAFLNIYPNFFENVNLLLKDEAQVSVTGHKLDTQCRILALIRLGMCESGKIARFLNCSPATIYTYRSLLYSAAKDRNTFEEAIKHC